MLFFGVFSQTRDTLGNALRGRDPEALLELLTAGKEGAKLAAMLGIPAIAVNTAVGKLRDPLRQAWEEANREVENAGSEGYNENTQSGQGGEREQKLDPGTYTDTIRWQGRTVKARPEGKGFWGERTKQHDQRVDQYELQINPNDESYYLPHPDGKYVQFENMVHDTVQDGKLIMKKRSYYHVYDMPGFAEVKVLKQAKRQLEAASMAGYTVEWLVSEERAAEQLSRLFKEQGINITVTYYPERR